MALRKEWEKVVLLPLRKSAPDSPDDPLPEDTHYRDTGCDLFPSCLRCPFPQCRYDRPSGNPARALRDRMILDDWNAGRPVPEIMARFGLSRRSIYRILDAQKSGQ
jgi:hypothetical protein